MTGMRYGIRELQHSGHEHSARNLKYNEFFSDENIQEEKEDKSLPKFQKGKLEILTKIQALNEKSW